MKRAITKQNDMTDIMVETDGQKSRAIMLHSDFEKQMILKGWKKRNPGVSVLGNNVTVYVRGDIND